MNTPKRPAATSENFVAISAGYNQMLLLPAALASQVLAHVKLVKHDWDNNKYTWTITDEQPEIKLVPGDEIIAAQVAKRLESK